MAARIGKFILSIIPKKMKIYLVKDELNRFEESLKYANLSYSQEGEDMILNRFFEKKNQGFYVDVGAHHPKRFSNTYNFYAKGWRGVNIDPLPNSMVAFEEERPDDINLEVGVSKQRKELYYYMFNEPALNTFSEAEAKKKDGLNNYKIIEKRKVLTYQLEEILDKHLGKNQKIDFMTIDAEGFDLDVLESNNWKKYRPTYVLVEDLNRKSMIDLQSKSKVYKYVISNNYSLVAKTINTLFFKDNIT